MKGFHGLGFRGDPYRGSFNSDPKVAWKFDENETNGRNIFYFSRDGKSVPMWENLLPKERIKSFIGHGLFLRS